jgi:hypothetical protein
MPLEDFTPGWQMIHVGLEGSSVSLDDVNPWEHSWTQLSEESIVVPHPSHPQERHRAWVYEVEGQSKRVRFAAGELSNGVWGFYLPLQSDS